MFCWWQAQFSRQFFPPLVSNQETTTKTWKKLSTRSWLESDEFPINLTLYMQREGHSGRRIFPNAQPLEVNLRLNIWCPGVPPEFLNHAAKIWREVSSQFETQHQVYCHPERKGDFGPVNKFLFQRGTWRYRLDSEGDVISPSLTLKSFLPRLVEGSQEVDIPELLHEAEYIYSPSNPRTKWTAEHKEVPTTGPKVGVALGWHHFAQGS